MQQIILFFLLVRPADIQINIKRCLSDGCDTRIHGLKTLGYQITKSKEVSVSDASAIWYLSLLTSLVTASMETNPVLGPDCSSEYTVRDPPNPPFFKKIKIKRRISSSTRIILL